MSKIRKISSKLKKTDSAISAQFKEPLPDPLVIMAGKLLAPIWVKFKEHLAIKIEGTPADLEAFSQSQRAVIMLNHPDRQDPFVIAALANYMHENFYCIAARECFDWDNGWRGWLFQKLGCYSVARGKADFHSINTTEKILRDGERKLVVFPEAEITADGEHVHDLQKAIFHISLDVQKKLPPATSVRIIPAAIKLHLLVTLIEALAPSLERIESDLFIPRQVDGSARERLDQVIQSYLTEVSRVYDLQKNELQNIEATEAIILQILQKIAVATGQSIDWPPDWNSTARLYSLRNKIGGDCTIASVAIVPERLHCAGIDKPCVQSDFERVERLLIMQRMQLHSDNDIQCCRILDFIESELFGDITPKGQQECLVRVGAPIEIAPFLILYNKSKEAGVAGLSDLTRQSLQNLLSKI